MLSKLYSVNYCPQNIDIKDIEKRYTFDIDNHRFKDSDGFEIAQLHGFFINGKSIKLFKK
jgi:hypothetical protein